MSFEGYSCTISPDGGRWAISSDHAALIDLVTLKRFWSRMQRCGVS